MEMEESVQEVVTNVAKTWRAARYDAAHKRAETVREIKEYWPELFLALEQLQRDWPK